MHKPCVLTGTDLIILWKFLCMHRQRVPGSLFPHKRDPRLEAKVVVLYFGMIELTGLLCCFIILVYLSDPTMITDNVAESMMLINDWNSLHPPYTTTSEVPRSQLTEIQQRCSTKREIANECASYYVHYHPQPSWTHLASQLYSEGEFAAVEKLKPFLPLRGNYIVHVCAITVCVCGN